MASIVYMGSSEFSVDCFNSLTEKHNILSVYTSEPRPSGRGQKINKTQVHLLAEGFNIPVKTPKKITEAEIEYVKLLNPDFIIVVSYGLILPQDFIDLARYACLNIHPSSLPRWRGASPVERAIEAGDNKTSVCVIKMTKKLDSGDIILKQGLTIDQKDDSNSILEISSKIGAKLVLDSIDIILSGADLVFEKQSEDGITYAKKISKQELFCELSCQASCFEMLNKIRAMASYGYCYVICDNMRVKIIKAEATKIKKTEIDILCLDGFVTPLIIKPEGRKQMDVKSFLNGLKNNNNA
jgi:methionyl-tRNA formyltransferase